MTSTLEPLPQLAEGGSVGGGVGGGGGKVIQSTDENTSYAEMFLKYYSGETILRHGKKYQIPSLESAEGGKWNVVSVISIASLFIKTRNKKDNLCFVLLRNKQWRSRESIV